MTPKSISARLNAKATWVSISNRSAGVSGRGGFFLLAMVAFSAAGSDSCNWTAGAIGSDHGAREFVEQFVADKRCPGGAVVGLIVVDPVRGR